MSLYISPHLIAHKADPPKHYGYVECSNCKLEGGDANFWGPGAMARHLLEHITHGHHVQPASAGIALEADYEYPDE